MRNRTKLMAILTMVVVLCGLCIVSVQAASFLDFAMGPPHPSTASVYFNGGPNNPLVGTDISVFNVAGIGTPINSGVVLPITFGDVDFTTGNFSGTSGNQWFFGGGGSLTVKGAISTLGLPAGTSLITGVFTNVSVTQIPVTYGGFTVYNFDVAVAGFQDEKNSALLQYFGYPANASSDGNFNLSFLTAGFVKPGDAFTSISVLSGDVVNFPVPLPPSMLLLGTGILGLVGLGWRRRKTS